MPSPVEAALGAWLSAGARGVGQIRITREQDAFVLCHRDDAGRENLSVYESADQAAGLGKFDDAGNYRPLKTAPNLKHGWRLKLKRLEEVQRALDLFYPGRLAALAAWEANRLATTPLRHTLGRQSGMYRVAAKISDGEIDELVGRFCRSRGGEPGCLRTILWSRDESKARPSVRLPLDKFIAPVDQTGRGEQIVPLLCQEACNLLVAAARNVVSGG
jgi:sirohydrochlorin cobaltochelatase